MARTMIVSSPNFVQLWKDEIIQGTHKWWIKNAKKTLNDIRFMKEPLISSLPVYKARKAATRIDTVLAKELLEDNQIVFIHNAETNVGSKIKIYSFLSANLFLVSAKTDNEIVKINADLNYYSDWGLKGLYYAVKNQIELKQEHYSIEKMFINPTVDLLKDTEAIVTLLSTYED